MEQIFTDQSIKEIISEGKPVMIDFWAPWCGPCKMISPIVEELAQEYAGQVVIGKLNVDENIETPEIYGIRNIPTILFFKNGEVADKLVGAVKKDILKSKIEALL